MDIDGAKVAPGYHFAEFGGNATYNIVPAKVVRSEYLLKFENMPFYKASLCEPYACLLYAFYSNFHTLGFERNNRMGILEGGKLAIMGGCGPMGLGSIELLFNMAVRPAMIVVTDVNQERIDYAKKVISEEYAAGKGIRLVYFNTSGPDPARALNDVTGGTGFDDIYIMCPVQEVIEQADAVCGYDGCINFFSGPVDKALSSSINFFDVHYKRKHIIGSAGSGVEDMAEILKMSEDEGFRTEVMVTHVGGLNCGAALLRDFPDIPGGKKLIYSNIDMELTAIEDFGKKEDPLFQKLHEICMRHNSLWSGEAEDYLLKHGKPI
jgi:threonine dehydrogenase-like Zn-dependent dehydrogenase